MARSDTPYKSADGRPLPSVSTILRVCYGGDDTIGHWANQLGLDGINYHHELEWRAQVGSLAHWYVEQSLGLPVGPPPGISTGHEVRDARGALMASDCADRLLTWWHGSGLSVLYAERQMVHPVLDYGGTPDMVAQDDTGALVVVDWKTSGSPTRKHRLQVAAYCSLVSAIEGRPARGVVVCAGITGGAVKTSQVKGAMLERMTVAFGHLRLAYAALSNDGWKEEEQ